MAASPHHPTHTSSGDGVGPPCIAHACHPIGSLEPGPLENGEVEAKTAVSPLTPRLVVEIDRGQHGRSSCGEAGRTEFLQKEGYRILRFWNNEILANLDGVHSRIADELSCITPALPSPIKGEGVCSS